MKRSHLLTILLSFFLGFFGFDRFYLGKIGTGIIKAATFGGLGIWWAYDLIELLYNKTLDIDGCKLEGEEVRDPTMLIFLSCYGGLLGLDRFYLGDTIKGIIKCVTLGGLGVWWLIDIYFVIKGELADLNNREIKSSDKKYQSVTLLFAVYGGIYGFDRFYLGHRSLGMIKLFVPTFGIWILLDIILIILNTMKDANGKSLLQE